MAFGKFRLVVRYFSAQAGLQDSLFGERGDVQVCVLPYVFIKRAITLLTLGKISFASSLELYVVDFLIM